MAGTAYFLNDPGWLSRLESLFWWSFLILGILAGVSGYLTYVVGRHRGEVQQELLRKELRGARVALEEKNRELARLALQSRQGPPQVEARPAPRGTEGSEPPQPPRLATDEYRRRFLSALGDAKGEISLQFSPEVESADLARQISKLLSEAGWSIVEEPAFDRFGHKPGLLLIIHSEEKAPPQRFALLGALKSIHSRVTMETDARRPEGSLTLLVGTTP